MSGHAGGARGRCRFGGPGLILGVLALALVSAGSASAQRLSGRLLDLDSNDPLEAGVLTLRTPAGVPVATAFTDDEGYWTFEVPRPGIYQVEATRFGYDSWLSGPVEVKAGDDLDSVFRLRRRPIRLDPVEVSVQATRRHLELSGFYERQRSDFGSFMGPELIEKRRARRITDLLLTLPGVRLVSMTTGSVGARYVQLRGSNLSQGGVCRPRVFVDGIMYAAGDSRPKPRIVNEETELQEEFLARIDQGLSLDDIGPPSSIAGIEVYRSAAQVPVQFGGTSAQTLCGVIVVWTRRGTIRPPGS